MNPIIKQALFALCIFNISPLTAFYSVTSSNVHNRFDAGYDQDPEEQSSVAIKLCCFMKRRSYVDTKTCLEKANLPIRFASEITIDDMYWLLLSIIEHEDTELVAKIFDGGNFGISRMFLLADPNEYDLRCEHRTYDKHKASFEGQQFDAVDRVVQSRNSFPEFLENLVRLDSNRILAYIVRYGLPKTLGQVYKFLQESGEFDSSCLKALIKDRKVSSSVVPLLLKNDSICSSEIFTLLCLLCIERKKESLLYEYFEAEVSPYQIIWSLLSESEALHCFRHYKVNFETLFSNVVEYDFRIVLDIMLSNEDLFDQFTEDLVLGNCLWKGQKTYNPSVGHALLASKPIRDLISYSSHDDRVYKMYDDFRINFVNLKRQDKRHKEWDERQASNQQSQDDADGQAVCILS